MAYFLFKCWHEKLYRAVLSDLISVQSTLAFDLMPITEENACLVEGLRGKEYVEQFQRQLKFGDTGYYAWIENKPVGYGWIKHTGSDDYFFRIGVGCIYLCRFFVHENFRGNCIYPAMINKLIDSKRSDKELTYYIAVERGNEASENGLKKVGFSFISEYGFLRGFKKTFNKKTLKHMD